MSLINKMLNDLERRNAFLDDNQDPVLDGLYSAYDLELKNKRKPNTRIILFVLIVTVILLCTTLFYPFNIDKFQIFNVIKSDNSITSIPDQGMIKDISNNSRVTGTELTVGTEKIENEKNHLLKLDNDLLLQEDLKTSAINPINRIDSIQFETNSSGINLIMHMPYEIDYLVYGLNNPNRTVIEVENAELGFKLEELVPVKTIVAIRYSINKLNRFKLVLESDRPLMIKKSMTSQSGDTHDLVVVMEYQWEGSEILQQDDTELTEIVEKQVEHEKGTVLKGELIKTPVGKDTDAYAEKLFQQAYIDYKRGDIAESLKKLNMSLDQNGGHIKARSTLALILANQGNTELAYSVLNEGLIQYPGNIGWTKMYARLLLKDGKIVEARSILAKQSPELSTNPEYYALQAAILQKLDEHQQAAKIYRDLLQVNPLKAVWWMGLGISLESMKLYDAALYAYQKAFNHPSLAKDTREFLTHRINRLSNLLKDESA